MKDVLSASEVLNEGDLEVCLEMFDLNTCLMGSELLTEPQGYKKNLWLVSLKFEKIKIW